MIAPKSFGVTRIACLLLGTLLAPASLSTMAGIQTTTPSPEFACNGKLDICMLRVCGGRAPAVDSNLRRWRQQNP
jgi:hypothetical protein